MGALGEVSGGHVLSIPRVFPSQTNVCALLGLVLVVWSFAGPWCVRSKLLLCPLHARGFGGALGRGLMARDAAVASTDECASVDVRTTRHFSKCFSPSGQVAVSERSRSRLHLPPSRPRESSPDQSSQHEQMRGAVPAKATMRPKVSLSLYHPHITIAASQCDLLCAGPIEHRGEYWVEYWYET